MIGRRMLPLQSLSWEDFEHLCVDLAECEFPNAGRFETYGNKGQKQEGIDIKSRDNSLICIQCKRVTAFNENQMETALDRFLQGNFVSTCQTFVLAVTAPCNRTQTFDVWGKVQEMNPQIKFILWNEQALFGMLLSQRAIVTKYFGEAFAQDFCVIDNYASAPTLAEFFALENFAKFKMFTDEVLTEAPKHLGDASNVLKFVDSVHGSSLLDVVATDGRFVGAHRTFSVGIVADKYITKVFGEAYNQLIFQWVENCKRNGRPTTTGWGKKVFLLLSEAETEAFDTIGILVALKNDVIKVIDHFTAYGDRAFQRDFEDCLPPFEGEPNSRSAYEYLKANGDAEDMSLEDALKHYGEESPFIRMWWNAVHPVETWFLYKQVTSYGYKHMVERFFNDGEARGKAHVYVSNMSFKLFVVLKMSYRMQLSTSRMNLIANFLVDKV